MKAVITNFQNFLDQSNKLITENTDEEQIRIVEKAVTEYNAYIEKLTSKTIDKFTKYKLLFPDIKVEEKIAQKITLHRQSSVLADKLWEELCGEREVENPHPEFVPPKKLRAKSVGNTGLHMIKSANVPPITEVNEKDDNTKPIDLAHETPPAIEKLLSSYPHEDEPDDPSEGESNNIDSNTILIDTEDFKIGSMNEMSFQEILQSLVTCPRGSDSSVLMVDHLENHLNSLRKQSGEGTDTDT